MEEGKQGGLKGEGRDKGYRSAVMKCFLLTQGLKTGMYYLRTRPAANAIQFTVDQKMVQKVRDEKEHDVAQQETNEQQDAMACSLQNKEACVMCSS